MDEFRYYLYIKESKKADELHKTIKEISVEEGWCKGIPEELVSSSRLHAYARMQGLITKEEYNLLRRFYK